MLNELRDLLEPILGGKAVEKIVISDDGIEVVLIDHATESP